MKLEVICRTACPTSPKTQLWRRLCPPVAALHVAPANTGYIPPSLQCQHTLCERQHRAACGLRKPPGGRPGCRWGTARLCVLYLRLQRTSSFPLYPAAAPRSPLPLLRAAICVGVARSPTTHRNPLHRCYSHPATRPVAWKSAVMRSDGGHPHLAPSHRSLHSRIAPGLTMALLFLRSHAAPHLPVPPGNRIGVDANRTAPLHCSPHRHRRRRVSGAPRLLAAVQRSFALYTLSIAVPTGMSTRSTAAQTRCTIHPVAAILDELGALAQRRPKAAQERSNSEYGEIYCGRVGDQQCIQVVDSAVNARGSENYLDAGRGRKSLKVSIRQ
jgi:hypothetical protein